jgi:cation:H+ antiporter
MTGLSTSAVFAVFLVASLATWAAGFVLADTTDALDDRFGLGEALGGLILLGFAGTLPEIAITVSAAHTGDLGLATGNLLGGIAVQTLVLVLLDALTHSQTPLTTLSMVLEPIVEALLVIIMLAIALLGHLLPASVALRSVSPTSILLVVVWLGGVWLLNRMRTSQRWQTVTEHVESAMAAPSPPTPAAGPGWFGRGSTRAVLVTFGAAAVVTLGAGVVLERSGDELAGRWGLDGVLFGATILAAVTALPEISTGLRAVRLGRVGLAMGDIFGGNQVQLTLFLLADLVAGQPVLQTVDPNTAWLGGVGVIVTALYAVGLVVRPPRKLLGIGPDSLLVLVAYVIGLMGLVRIT